MIFCPKCHSQLLEGAKFCHNCGTNIEIPLGDCGSCGKKNPADAQFCYACGNPMGAIQMPRVYDGRSKYDFQHLDVLEEQIKALFFEESASGTGKRSYVLPWRRYPDRQWRCLTSRWSYPLPQGTYLRCHGNYLPCERNSVHRERI